jgi:hypothetical protein
MFHLAIYHLLVSVTSKERKLFVFRAAKVRREARRTIQAINIHMEKQFQKKLIKKFKPITILDFDKGLFPWQTSTNTIFS